MRTKFYCAGLVLGLSSVLLSCSIEASNPTLPWLQQSQFVKPVTFNHNQQAGHLVVNEAKGIALLDAKGNVLSEITRKAEHLDLRYIDDAKQIAVITSIDINTGEVLLIELDLLQQTLAVKQSYKHSQSAFDAVCLSSSKQGVDLFSVNTLGEATHLNVYQFAADSWNIREINRFTVGPNVKSCAVAENSESLYVTEENIGVWRYSINPEHELIRDLLQLPKGLEVEYVDTTSESDVAVVSPSTNQLWLLNSTRDQFESVDLPMDVEPKSVQLNRNGSQLTAYIFDDKQAVMTTKIIERAESNTPASAGGIPSLPAFSETDPVVAYGDAADDPAIWLNTVTPERSLVYGTDKKHGLNVYDLNGKLVKSLAVGRVNNVDIRYDVEISGQSVDLAAASNRTNKSISLFTINKQTGVPSLVADIKTDLDDPYGLCMSKLDDEVSVWINDTNGRFQRYVLNFSGQSISANMVFEWRVPSQPEGCVSDDANALLYYGEEATGVWLKHINSTQDDSFIAGLNPEIEADIEGIGLYQFEGSNYLVVSSQGNNRYAVYKTNESFDYLGAFEVGVNWDGSIDGASETDGLEVTSTYLGKHLPDGLMVVQDGRNVMPRAPQNFKLVDGRLLKNWIKSKL